MAQPTHPRYTPGRILLTLVGLITITSPYIADWNETHVYNPNWPPHAKFHNYQTMALGVTLGLATLYYAWRPAPSSSSSPYATSQRRDDLFTASIFGGMYWVTQIAAWFYPGSMAADYPMSVWYFPQKWIAGGLLVVCGVGYWCDASLLGRRGVVGKGKGKGM